MREHIRHYIVIIFIFIAILSSRIFLNFEANLLLSVLYLVSFIYIAWGIIHHLLEHDLTVRIVVEYILIGTIAMLSSTLVIKGGLL